MKEEFDFTFASLQKIVELMQNIEKRVASLEKRIEDITNKC